MSELPEGVEQFDMPSGESCYYRDRDHQYSLSPAFKRDERLAGISTVAKNSGETGADGLMDWACRLSYQGIARGLAHDPGPWTGTAETIGTYLKDNRLDWRGIRDEAGDRGTDAHDVLQQLAEGVTPPFSGGHQMAILDWWRKRRPEALYVETVVFDHERMTAGRFDLLYGPEETPTLLDLKTGSVRNAAFVQLNLYKVACRVAGYPIPTRLLILDTRDDGSWKEVEVPIKSQWAKAALDVYRAGAEMGKALRAARKTAESGGAELPLEAAA